MCSLVTRCCWPLRTTLRSPTRARSAACRLIGSPRYRRSVCDTCYPKTVDSQGRRVSGYNTSLTGGFEATYVGADGASEGICHEVTDSGRCWIDGHACTIQEAKFGGVVVQAL